MINIVSQHFNLHNKLIPAPDGMPYTITKINKIKIKERELRDCLNPHYFWTPIGAEAKMTLRLTIDPKDVCNNFKMDDFRIYRMILIQVIERRT